MAEKSTPTALASTTTTAGYHEDGGERPTADYAADTVRLEAFFWFFSRLHRLSTALESLGESDSASNGAAWNARVL